MFNLYFQLLTVMIVLPVKLKFVTAVKNVKAPTADEYLISPITGEKIAASKVQEHMRIGLLDPRWVEQRDKHIQDKMNQETVYAPGNLIFIFWNVIFCTVEFNLFDYNL